MELRKTWFHKYEYEKLYNAPQEKYFGLIEELPCNRLDVLVFIWRNGSPTNHILISLFFNCNGPCSRPFPLSMN